MTRYIRSGETGSIFTISDEADIRVYERQGFHEISEAEYRSRFRGEEPEEEPQPKPETWEDRHARGSWSRGDPYPPPGHDRYGRWIGRSEWERRWGAGGSQAVQYGDLNRPSTPREPEQKSEEIQRQTSQGTQQTTRRQTRQGTQRQLKPQEAPGPLSTHIKGEEEKARIKRELEERGIPILKDEKIDTGEKALLKTIKVSEKIAGEGTGFWSGIRLATAEMVAGTAVTVYAGGQLGKRAPKATKMAAGQIARHPKESAGTVKEFTGEVGSSVKETKDLWWEEFKEMPLRKKIGYAGTFLLAGKVGKAGVKGAKAAKTTRVKGGKLVLKGEQVTPELIKAKAKAKAPKKGRTVESVDVEATGEATLIGEEAGYVKKTVTRKGEGIKIQKEVIEPRKEAPVNYPMEAEVRTVQIGKKTYTERTTTGERAVTDKGEVRNIVRERQVKEVKKEGLKGTVEERRTIPEIKGESQRIVHDAGLIEKVKPRAKEGGMLERSYLREEGRTGRRPITIIEEPTRLKPGKTTILPRYSVGPVEKGREKEAGLPKEGAVEKELERQRQRQRPADRQKQTPRQKPTLITDSSQTQRQKQKTGLIQKLITPVKRPPQTITERPPREPRIPPKDSRAKKKEEEEDKIFKLPKTYRIKDVWRLGVNKKKLGDVIFGRRRKR